MDKRVDSTRQMIKKGHSESNKEFLGEDDLADFYVFHAGEERCMQLEEAFLNISSHRSSSSRIAKKWNQGRLRRGNRARDNKPNQSKVHNLNSRKLHSPTKIFEKTSMTSKKKLARQQEVQAQLIARKENIQERVKDLMPQTSDIYGYRDECSTWAYDVPYQAEDYILPAEDLGVDEGSMYDRLLRILEGDEITPQDYELLLRLDGNNAKSTLEEEAISEIPILVITEQEGIAEAGNIPIGEIKIDQCEICLEPWFHGAKVKRLPCDHVFCKECIDYWLKGVSQKCPNLSCYWCNEEHERKDSEWTYFLNK